MAFVPGDAVRLGLGGKRRPDVVLRVEPDRCLIAYGTTIEHDLQPEPILLRPDGRQGRILDLAEPTYFYGQNVAWATLSEFDSLGTRCSIELYETLRDLHEQARSAG